jgi:hypothetical protein
LLALALACSAPAVVPVPNEEIAGTPFTFLEDGRVTREEVLLRLGTPSTRHEGERVITYAFGKNSTGWSRAGRIWLRDKGRFDYQGRPGHPYNLVLVFRPDGVLARHSLVVTR